MANDTWEKITSGKDPDVLVTFGGQTVSLAGSKAWAGALMAKVEKVGTAFAVRGPQKRDEEMPARLVADLATELAPSFATDPATKIHVVAHSSGVAFASNFFDALTAALKAKKIVKDTNRISFYFLDGGGGGSSRMVQKNRLLFVQACAVTGHVKTKAGIIPSRNFDSMTDLGDELKKAKLGGFTDVDLGKKPGSDKWPPDPNILHMALVNPAKPLWFNAVEPAEPKNKSDAKEAKKYEAAMKEYAATKKREDAYPKYYPGNIKPTYETCTASTVTADYFT